MQSAMSELGFLQVFDHIDIKPGRPSKCFAKDGKFVFAMAGNPMAAFVLTRAVILPILFKLSGASEAFSAEAAIYAKLASDLKLKSGRVNLTVGAYEGGVFTPMPSPSGRIRPLAAASHFFLADPECDKVRAGEIVKIYEI